MAGPNSNPDEMNNPSSSPLSSISEPDLSSFSPRPTRSRKTRRQSSSSKNGDKEMPERPKRKTIKRTPKKPKWDAESILTDPKSPLATASLRSILSNPMAWTALDRDERAEILSLFPDKGHIIDAETEDARPNFASLLNDDSFRHHCAAYTENIAHGRHDLEWLASAWTAHERRKAGDFDEHLTTKLEEDWEVEIPEEMKLCRKQPEQTEYHEKSGDTGESKTAVDIDMKEESVSTKQSDETKLEVDGAEAARDS